MIKWTNRARNSFVSIINYLLEEWGEKSAKKFVILTHKTTNTLSKSPLIGRIEVPEKNIRSLVFTKQNSIIYRVTDNNKIIILKIFDNRQNPSKKLK